MEITQDERKTIILASYSRGLLAGVVIGIFAGGLIGWIATSMFYYNLIIK
jgi:hypothetical protein